jgi:2-polyprenyl-3-methyl-5-hydroxy-6-metoxy-1,4-benzoquinol methylase
MLVQCPVCHESVTQPPLHRYTAEQAANHFCPAARNADRHARLLNCIRRLFGGEAGEVYHCNNCGFGFAWPFVGGDEEYYSILHEQAGYTKWRWEYGLTLQTLKNLPPGKILDIGAGDGAFLKAVDKSWQTFATEGSEATRKILRDAGIQCFADTKDAIRQAAGTFDVVTMFQVLEHIAQFDQMLADCREILRPGGSLIVSVPEGDAVRDQEDFTGCADMIPNHCNKWTPKALGLAMQRAGFAPQSPAIEPHSMRMYYLRADLKVRAKMATQPNSLAAKANGIHQRFVRLGALASLLGIEWLLGAAQFSRMSAGQSFTLIGKKN